MQKLRFILLILTSFVFFTCEEDTAPPEYSSKINITLNNATEIEYRSANFSGDISDTYGASISQHGLVWDTFPKPTVEDEKLELGKLSEKTNFSSKLEALQPDKKYHARAYFVVGSDTVYSKEKTFNTLTPEKPELTTLSVTEINESSALFSGEVKDEKGEEIITRGFIYSTSSNIPNKDTITIYDNDNTIGQWSQLASSLLPNTRYYVSAFASNKVGTNYGEEFPFTTSIAPPSIETGLISEITDSSAICEGLNIDVGGGSVLLKGVCWGQTNNPTLGDCIGFTTEATNTGDFASFFKGLTYKTDYYVRAYVKNENGTSYGASKPFTTLAGKPKLTTEPITSIRATSATSGGTIINDGGETITVSGVCWNTTGSPTINNNKTTDGTVSGTFASTISGLNVNTTYHLRAYATNSMGTGYGEKYSFTTKDGVAKLSTTAPSNITTTSATSGGNISDDGGYNITARGVCWASNVTPTINDNITEDGTGAGIYTSAITGLVECGNYYVRAYATNEIGTTYYGAAKELNSTCPGPPVVALLSVLPESITYTGASANCDIISDGGKTINASGVVWSTSPTPTIESNIGITTDGSISGVYTSKITGLTECTTYYVRAYATNEKGPAYSEQEISFTTACIVPPTVTTITISNITASGAASGVTIDNDGGGTISASGIVWSTSPAPTVESNLGSTTDGTGNITGLTDCSTYYVRAYASNERGTEYGNELDFTTTCIVPPTVTTSPISNITKNSASSGGNVTSDGGGTVSARGVVWSTAQNPTIESNLGITTDGAGLGTFTNNITGLTEYTTYYVRAYATNEAGPSYGEQITFATNSGMPNVDEVTSVTIRDNYGNDDGRVNSQEQKISFKVVVRNNGDGIAHNLTGTLELTDSNDQSVCYISDPQELISQVAPGATGIFADFDFDMSGMPTDNVLNFRLTISYTDASGKSYQAPPIEGGMLDVNVYKQTYSSVINPSNDATVTSNAPNTNYNNSILLVQNNTNYIAYSYINFLGSELPPQGASIKNAKLRLYCIANSQSSQMVSLYLSNSTWSENSITWNNDPGFDINFNTAFTVTSTGRYYEVDIKKFVAEWISNGNTGLVLRFSNGDEVGFNSSEAGSNVPELHLEYE